MAAQPNLHHISQLLTDISAEIANLPPVAGVQQIINQLHEMNLHMIQRDAQMQNQLDQMQQQVDQTQQQLEEIQASILGLQQAQNRLPMRLFNSVVSMTIPILYPPGFVVPEHFPTTKTALMNLTAQACMVVAQALELAPMPANAHVEQRRQQIMDYLSCIVV